MASDGPSASNPPPEDEMANDEDMLKSRSTKPSNLQSTLERFKYGTRAGTSILKRKSPFLADPTPSKASSTASSSPPQKKHRHTSKYADPSKYAHLSPLTDILEPNLIGVFVGFNPGVMTATRGHAYAHPSNSFWKLVHSSGITERRLRPEEDVTLPRLYAMGNTNLVSRPTKDAAELSKQEQIDSTPVLDAKIARFRPEAVCIVGKSIWEMIWTYRYGKKPTKEQFKYGWQDEKHNMGLLKVDGEEDVEDDDWEGARVFVATSTSGLSGNLKFHEKEDIWRPFGEFVQKRREERKAAKTDS